MTASTARWTLLALAATALSGCGLASDPASEAPVEIVPGLYRITMGGEYRGFAMPDQGGPSAADGSRSGDGEYCVTSGNGHLLIEQITRRYALHPTCAHQPAERVGNAISGSWRCQMDQNIPGGFSSMSYSGVISAEEVEASGTLRMELPANVPGMAPAERAQMEQAMEMMDNIGITVTATRVADCG